MSKATDKFTSTPPSLSRGHRRGTLAATGAPQPHFGNPLEVRHRRLGDSRARRLSPFNRIVCDPLTHNLRRWSSHRESSHC
jgi:hypothetical protein